MVGKQKLKEGELGSRPSSNKEEKWVCQRCDALNFISRSLLCGCGKSWKHWKEEDRDNENEAEHGWSEEVRPKWTATVVAAGDGMKVVNTEEMQQYVQHMEVQAGGFQDGRRSGRGRN